MLPAALQREILKELVAIAPLLAAFERLFVKTVVRSDKLTLREVCMLLAAYTGHPPPTRLTADGQRFFKQVRRVLAHLQFETHYPQRTTTVYGIKRVSR